MSGQGTRSLILLTTNDELGRLHPAVTRPGRCAGVVEFRRFRAAEATRWRGRTPETAQELTLAELYALRHGSQPDSLPTQPVLTGAYL